MIPWLAAAIGGVMLALAFPPWRLDFLLWLAFVPLLYSLEGERDVGRASLISGLFGATFFLIDVRWVLDTLMIHGRFSLAASLFTYVALAAFLSVFPTLFGFVVALFVRRGISGTVVAPLAWVSTEYLRSMVFTGFPWDLVGYAFAERLHFVQLADITGVYGISFLVVLVNGGIFELLRLCSGRKKGDGRLVVAAALMLAMTAAYGYQRLATYSSPTPEQGFPVAVLQGNIPQDIKWEVSERRRTFETYERLARTAVQQGARLLVWPETSAPVLFGSLDLDWRIPTMMSAHLGVPMLVGAPSIRVIHDKTVYHNSAFLVDATGIRYRYDKIHLVPFGEYMPLSWLLPLGPGIAAREEDYTPGETMTVMHVPGGSSFSVLICYEAIFPDLARTAVKTGARFLVNMTNDGWFGRSAAPEQHLAMAGIRSIENRVWMVRAANTGISAAFDATGRRVSHIPLEQEGVFIVSVPESPSAKTFYNQYGDIFVYVCLATLSVLLAGFRKIHP